VQLRVIDRATRRPHSPPYIPPSIHGATQQAHIASSSHDAGHDSDGGRDTLAYAHSFLQNPYYFMFASLAKPDDDTELHWLKVGVAHPPWRIR
jgi:hypothetical protein